nr:sugar transferase [Octadecabacter dasysiphoniae]
MCAALALIALSPVLLIVAVFIKTDGGPVFFRQARLGLGGAEFSVFKFRSMIVDADKYLNEKGEASRPRITRVGQFIRKTSIDELPQFINVVLGDMALIGPRPILPRMLPFMTRQEKERFQVRPGLSGFAQVSGRNSVKWSKRFEYDVTYVKTAGIRLDAWIVYKTLMTVILRKDIADDRNASQVDDVTNRPLQDSQ